MGTAVAGVGSAFATYFLPVTAIIGGVVLALSFVRDLLPFSDAKEGPLADLTQSGMALLETL
jgi:hypothetical protein